MAGHHYSMSPYTVDTILSWARSGDIAVPEIQRPFVWTPAQVRSLLDSLYRGFPVGFLIAWRNPNIRLRDGSRSAGKRLLIDGQQRVTALMTAVLGMEVVTKEYDRVTIRVAFNPLTGEFDNPTPAIMRDPAWIPDISVVFDSKFSVIDFITDYSNRNPDSSRDTVYRNIERLRDILGNHIGMVELNPELSIEIVAEIFFRVNREGTPLSQANFVMSKIACNEEQDGVNMRKAIDYFCHIGISPGFQNRIKDLDPDFSESSYYKYIAWLRDDTDELYAPTYQDLLRVAFASSFGRGSLEDLVAALSGYNFDTRKYNTELVETSYATLKQGLLDAMNETNFKKFVSIIASAGFIVSSQINSRNAMNFAYVSYLFLRKQRRPQDEINKLVRRWFVFALLTGRYTGQRESSFDQDVRQIREQGFDNYTEAVTGVELSAGFWNTLLLQNLGSTTGNNLFRILQAAQIFAGEKAFLSTSIPVSQIVHDHIDPTPVFSPAAMRKSSVAKSRVMLAPNLITAHDEIAEFIGDRLPSNYLADIKAGKSGFEGLISGGELDNHLKQHCIPENIFSYTVSDFETFMTERRKLIAAKLRVYYNSL